MAPWAAENWYVGPSVFSKYSPEKNNFANILQIFYTWMRMKVEHLLKTILKKTKPRTKSLVPKGSERGISPEAGGSGRCPDSSQWCLDTETQSADTPSNHAKA